MEKEKVPYSEVDTPAVLLDLEQLEANIREMSQQAAEAGIKLRPHVKIHECADIAKMQIEAGACGIEVGNVAHAEAMAEAGIDDILIAQPFIGAHKLETLKRILTKTSSKISIMVDLIEHAEAYSQVGQTVGRKIPVFMKIETGANRCGVLPGESALDMAKKLRQLPGIELVAIYAHEHGPAAMPSFVGRITPEGIDEVAFEVASIMAETARMLRKEGITLKHVTVGASPTFKATCRYIKEGKFPEITEVHPGNYAVSDLGYMVNLGNPRETCALTVLTTVMSNSHPDHVVIDAGYKTLGDCFIKAHPDTPGFSKTFPQIAGTKWEGGNSYGDIKGHPDLFFGRVSAESSCLYYLDPDVDPKKKLSLGERLEIVPTNATLVVNLHDQIYGIRKGKIEKVIPVTGRGRGY